MDTPLLILLLVCLLLIVALVFIVLRFRKLGSQHATLQQEHNAFRGRYQDVIDVEEEKQRVTTALETERGQLSVAINRLKAERDRAESAFQGERKSHRDEARTILEGIETLKKELDELSEHANLQEFGIYEPRYDFESSERY